MIKGLTSVLLLICFFTHAREQDHYRVQVDLTSVKDDQLKVSVYPPTMKEELVEYHMAKIVPGTYDESNFGNFVTRFKAFDADGMELKVERLDTNRWQIESGQKLHQLTYWVHDTFDRFGEYGKEMEEFIFEPGGTNFDRYRDIYVLNTFGLVGYISHLKDMPYEMEIKHPKAIYGASALTKNSLGDTLDIFSAEDFSFLADGPIMYSLPDTTTRKIANAEVMVSCYSPNKLVTSKEIMDQIYDLMIAQAAYLGGRLPVDRYSYLIYLVDDKITPYFGALEHSYSTLFYLFENDINYIGKYVRDIAAHEFFHIVTPLNIHSEEIGDFDYINPEMSKHLWLYEGVTEYSSMHVQVKHGLYSIDNFIEEIRQKIFEANAYPEVSFTEMSENILEPKYASMYPNVYAKGALIGLCLDLYLLKYSNGNYDLQDLMRDLSKKYGKHQAFDDEKLFDVIEELTFPEVRVFLDTYVAGSAPLPLKEAFEWVGINYTAEGEESDITFGNVGLQQNDEGQLMITDISEMDAFGRKMGYQEGDVILKIHDKETGTMNIYDIIDYYFSTTLPGDKVSVIVQRINKRGKLVEKKLKAKAFNTTRKLRFELGISDDITTDEQRLLLSWLTPEEPSPSD